MLNIAFKKIQAGLFIALFFIIVNAHADDSLDDEFQQLSLRIYQSQTQNLPSHLKNIDNISKLNKKIKELGKDDKDHLAIVTIVANLKTIYKDIRDEHITETIWFLYTKNAKNIADIILNRAKSEANSFIVSKLSFQLAKYYYEHKNWEDVIRTLQNTDINNALSQEETDYAYLITGISLQHVRQHRDALKVYDAIDNTSPYAVTALLNKSIANIRQGWWTDAHIDLKSAIALEKKEEMIDRLYLTLGFSQIQHEFYRDARENFRSVGLEGPHSDRALLGIGISAMHQKDFSGALNAFTILNEKGEESHSLYDSYLLIPFVYEKIGEKRIASAKYTQASVYFQQLISQTDLTLATLSEDKTDLYEKYNSVPNHFDLAIQLNLIALQKFESINLNEKDRREVQRFKNTYTQLALKEIKSSFDEKKVIFQSYLSQCKYALAKLYDQE